MNITTESEVKERTIKFISQGKTYTYSLKKPYPSTLRRPEANLFLFIPPEDLKALGKDLIDLGTIIETKYPEYIKQ